MSADGNGVLDLPVVDGLELEDELREAFRPGERVEAPGGLEIPLPRWFYRVESWELAKRTPLSAHFRLHELMRVDVREAREVRRWPRHVPCGITLLAAQLELVRQAAGTLVWVAANGGYRSPSHRVGEPSSPHCWGMAANIFKVGDELLDSRERIERTREMVRRVAPAAWVRPWGHGKGEADDHVHLDMGWAGLTPRGSDETGPDA